MTRQNSVFYDTFQSTVIACVRVSRRYLYSYESFSNVNKTDMLVMLVHAHILQLEFIRVWSNRTSFF
jgi:hypothetical protein